MIYDLSMSFFSFASVLECISSFVFLMGDYRTSFKSKAKKRKQLADALYLYPIAYFLSKITKMKVPESFLTLQILPNAENIYVLHIFQIKSCQKYFNFVRNNDLQFSRNNFYNAQKLRQAFNLYAEKCQKQLDIKGRNMLSKINFLVEKE